MLRDLPRHLGAALFRIYFTVDPRSLGLCRIGLGTLLLYDLVRRVPGLTTWYTNAGLVPNHTSLWRPGAPYMFSFLFAASTGEEAAWMFALSGVVFLLFIAGYRTRLFHALSLACTVSLHSRAIVLENGGDVVLNVLCAWTLFLPMGARFSIDALRSKRPPETRPVASLAVLAILLQLAVIYYMNALAKPGWTWQQGSAVHYVFYQERMVTWFGFLARPYVTPALAKFMTYATVVTEYSAAFLILNPIGHTVTRRVAMIVLTCLHLAFAAVLNLGQFSFNMIGFFPLLLGARDWELLERHCPQQVRGLFDRVSALFVEKLPAECARSASPARRWIARRRTEVRELTVIVVAIALGSQVLWENKAVPARYKFGQANWMQQVVTYPRLYQGWQMFSPDVPTGERMLYVDAITVDGRHVDPYNEAGSRVAHLPVERIPPHMEQDEFWCDFTNRVPDSDTYWRALREWIYNYPRRTGKTEDRIVSFEVKLLESDSPPPGEREPRNFRTKMMMRGVENQ